MVSLSGKGGYRHWSSWHGGAHLKVTGNTSIITLADGWTRADLDAARACAGRVSVNVPAVLEQA
ncbi:MAG: hypothetical protein ACRCZD_17795 [Phycicoccus sp.]